MERVGGGALTTLQKKTNFFPNRGENYIILKICSLINQTVKYDVFLIKRTPDKLNSFHFATVMIVLFIFL